MTVSTPQIERVDALARRLVIRKQRMAVAESCTGGLISTWLTDKAGSSAWFDCGLVTYSNAAKQGLLGVSEEILQRHGAVSAATVMAMTQGLLNRSGVDWALAVSGIAGPDGGTPDKPVGTVWIAWQGATAASSCSRFLFAGDRATVRVQAALAALDGLQALVTV